MLTDGEQANSDDEQDLFNTLPFVRIIPRKKGHKAWQPAEERRGPSSAVSNTARQRRNEQAVGSQTVCGASAILLAPSGLW